ncbi:hypothetical protein SAMN06298211_105132 [Prevotellaceae bacterium MN60]|nr:hypothetical protein SAMN06298211_105132 [Prevotellaceae bacterium MN60]
MMNNLSLDYINAKSPYLVKRADDGDYVFQTAKGIIYGVGFIENEALGGCETYQLSISNQNKLHASYDPDVKNTILVIVDEFFRENLDGLLYMCDTSDSREAARNRLFLRWFEEYAEPKRFTIRTANAVVEGQGIYAAIIVENRNPMVLAIIDDFELTAKMLTGEK